MQRWSLDLDGARLTGSRFGDGERVVVLLHGMRYDQTSWHAFAQMLAQAGLGALTLDFRGYGESSPRPEKDTDGQDVAQVVLALLTEGTKEVCLLGGSMGAGAALEAAAVEGAQVARIAVLSPAVEAAQIAPRLPAVPLLILASRDEVMVDESVNLQRLSPHAATLHLYEGDAHAQALLQGPHQADVERRLLSFLTEETSR